LKPGSANSTAFGERKYLGSVLNEAFSWSRFSWHNSAKLLLFANWSVNFLSQQTSRRAGEARLSSATVRKTTRGTVNPVKVVGSPFSLPARFLECRVNQHQQAAQFSRFAHIFVNVTRTKQFFTSPGCPTSEI
jgi:hypothetical protein